MDVKLAHQSLLNFSKTNAGIGISIDVLKKIIEKQISHLNSHFSKMDSNQKFKKTLKISFSGDFDLTNLKVRFSNFINPNDANEFYPQLVLENLRITINGFLESKHVVKIELEYPEILGIIQLANKKIKISLLTENHVETNFSKLWETDANLKMYLETTHGVIDQDWNDLTMYFKATSLFSGRDIAEGFIDSLILPDVFKVFTGIKFGDNEKLSADASGNLLMFTAESLLNFNHCPLHNASGKTHTISTSHNENQATGEPKIIVETQIDENSETLEYTSNKNEEMIHDGNLFLFTPIDLLRFNFDIVKPSITASDSDNFGPVYYRYSVTSAIKSVNLSLINPWPIEFQLSIPTEVTGQAGAGVKIGCIRYEALGAMFDGNVIPFDINFKIHLDWSSRQIVFESKIANIKASDFSFRTFPSLDFPISQVIEIILAKAAEFIITEQAGKMLNVTRIPIANLAVLEKTAKVVNAFAGETDKLGNVTMGVMFNY